MRSIVDLAAQFEALPATGPLRRIFAVTGRAATCTVGAPLAARYGLTRGANAQLVVSVTNRWTHEQTWWNALRSTKPQTFKADGAVVDPTGGDPQRCDFCRWQELTAVDTFGRVELPEAVTGSNLFKYAQPHHGVVLLRRHHDPLGFTQAALADAVDASWLWLLAAQQEQQQQQQQQQQQRLHPFLLWNALPRAGASQFHSHLQVMLTDAPTGGQLRLDAAAAAYARAQQQQQSERGGVVGSGGNGDDAGASSSSGGGSGSSGRYLVDLAAAHGSVGLLRRIAVPAAAAAASAGAAQRLPQQQPQRQRQRQHVAWMFPSIAPVKDAEVLVLGAHPCCPAFQRALFVALRALIDGAGAATFNVGVLSIDLAAPPPAGVGLERQHWRSSGSGGDGDGGGIRASSSTSSVSSAAAAGDLQPPPLSASASSWSSLSLQGEDGGDGDGGGFDNDPAALLEQWGAALQAGGRAPVLARVVSRGKLSSAASDFGGLEVFGGASIGHTDPFVVARLLDERLAAADAAAADVGAQLADKLPA